MKIRRWEEKITERGQVKREGKSIYYAIRFHAGKHSIPSSVQLTMPLFRRNSPHPPQHMKRECEWGKGFLHPHQAQLLFSRFFHQIITFWILDEKLAGVNGILVLEQSQPQPQRISVQALTFPLGEKFPLASSAHFQPSSSMFLYRSSTSLSLHSPTIISFQWASFHPAHPLTAYRICRGYLLL